MINAVNGSNVAIREVEQPQGEVKQQNISYRGNPTFERNPEYDCYGEPKRSGRKAVGVIATVLGIAALAFAGGGYFKGKKLNPDAKFFEKIGTGCKELWGGFTGWVKNLFKKS